MSTALSLKNKFVVHPGWTKARFHATFCPEALPSAAGRPPGLAGGEKINLVTGINHAMRCVMRNNPKCLIFGEDVGFGGVFRAAAGLPEEFGKKRVFNTPLSETGIVALGIGLAATGYTAIAEIQFADYIFPGFDQIVNQAAKFRFRSGNSYNCGNLTIRAPYGAVGHGGLYHSQSVEAYFTHTPGLKIVIPRGPFQAKGLLISSLLEPDPVLFFEPKILYRAAVDLVPDTEYKLPLEKGDIVKCGKHITIVAWGSQVHRAMQAIQMAEKRIPGLSCELIDLQTLLPWDTELVEQSVRKTGRLLVTHEAPITGGFGAEIVTHITETCFSDLEYPPQRVCGYDTPFPLVYEQIYIPSAYRILDRLTKIFEAA